MTLKTKAAGMVGSLEKALIAAAGIGCPQTSVR
jgi:hypothetical protein